MTNLAITVCAGPFSKKIELSDVKLEWKDGGDKEADFLDNFILDLLSRIKRLEEKVYDDDL